MMTVGTFSDLVLGAIALVAAYFFARLLWVGLQARRRAND